MAAKDVSEKTVLLNEMVSMSWLWTVYHVNVEHGDYYECRICKGEGKPRQLVSSIAHTIDCWIVRARTIDQPEDS